MILDNQCKLSDGQVLTASAVSANTYDKGARGDNPTNELYLFVRANAALDSANHTATLQVKVQTADAVDGNNALSGAQDLALSPVIDAPIAAGTVIFLARLPVGLKRYFALDYIVGTESFNAGSVDAFLVSDPEIVGQMLRGV